MTKVRIFSVLLLFCVALAPARPCLGAPTWTLTWSDEFNGAASSLPDPTRWTYDLGGGGWGNGELETYTNSASNVFQDGSGRLVIQALNNGGYTSARIKSQGLFNQAYGRIEASIQLPAGTTQGSGLWPAFWMLGNDIGSVGWPACGEIDIMENIGQYNTATQNLGHIHGPVAPGGGDYNGGNGVGTAYTLPAGQAVNTAFHLYAVEWNPSSVTFYVDGTAYQTLTAANLPAGGQWVFNHPFFIILNLAIGGGVGGPVTCSFPQQLLVDYVRVYKLTNNGTGAYNGTPAAVPGTIQAENFDTYNDAADPTEPGEGFAYNDLETANRGGQGRGGEGVDMETCADTGGGVDVDWTCPGEWLQYTVNVVQNGTYALTARVASSGPGGTFHFDVDGTSVTGQMACPDTGGWQNWQDVTAGGISLSTGQHQLLLVEDSMGSGGLGVCNFNYFTLALAASPTPTVSPSQTSRASPTGSSTATPSLSVTPSKSPTQTSSATDSTSPSQTATGTLTAGSTPLGPSGTPTSTPAATPSFSVTPLKSSTQTSNPTPTASPSRSPSPAPSATGTASPAASASPSETGTAIQTQGTTPSLTATGSVTSTPTGGLTAVGTALPTTTCTPTSPVGPSPDQASGVLDLRPWPNPVQRGVSKVWIRLGQPVEGLRWRVFSPAFVLVGEGSWSGTLPSGGQMLSLDSRRWPLGLLFLQALLPDQDSRGSKVAKVYVLP